MKTPFNISGRLFAMILIAMTGCVRAGAQVQPPKPISVYHNPAYDLRFGAIYLSSTGGTLTILPDGSRSSTGGVIEATLSGFTYGAASFEILANPGTIISVVNGPDVTLSGSGGGTMNLHVGASDPKSPFITSATPPSVSTVYIGGVLTVGSPTANPVGTYTGTFYVMFLQE